METVIFAEEYKERGVVGVDLCGNPAKGTLDQFYPALELAVKKKLKLAIHIAELPDNPDETRVLFPFCLY